MKNLIIAFILLLGVLSLCFSCEKDHLAGKFLLTDEMKAQNPYKVDETLKLISNTGDTLSWFVKGRNNQIHKTPVGINTSDYYLIEVEQTSIVVKNATENGYIFFQMGGQLTASQKYTMSLSLGEKVNEFSFNVPFSTETTPYIDSLYVMNRWIKDVFIHESASSNKLYYSTEFGIVKIDFSDGSYWELEKIEWADEN